MYATAAVTPVPNRWTIILTFFLGIDFFKFNNYCKNNITKAMFNIIVTIDIYFVPPATLI